MYVEVHHYIRIWHALHYKIIEYFKYLKYTLQCFALYNNNMQHKRGLKDISVSKALVII